MVFIDDDFFEFDSSIIGQKFPWYYPGEASYEKVQAYYHLLMSRNFENPEIVSEYYPYFERIFTSFCEKFSIQVNKIFGAAVHQMLDSWDEHQPFHVDFPFPHKVLIMYLTDNFERGHTLFMDPCQQIKPKVGKIVCFDGLRRHAAEYPVNGRRVVCIFTFL